MSGKDVREFLYNNISAQSRQQSRYETDDEIGARITPSFESQREDRVLTLLSQLGERLIRSERERLEMKETVGRYSDLISALEKKVSKQEEFEDEIRARQEKMERDYAAQMQKMQKAVLLAERIEDAINQQNRLARRIEQITQDKARMLRKLERIEEAVVETQSALNAKSLVLVSDQNRAVNDPSARIERPANDTDSAWQTPNFRRFASAVAVCALVAGLSWGVYQSIPQTRFVQPELRSLGNNTDTTNTAQNTLATPPAVGTSLPDIRETYRQQQQAYGTTQSPYTGDVNSVVENLLAPEETAIPAEDIATDVPQPTPMSPAVETPVPTISADVKPTPVPSVTDTKPVSDILSKSDDELMAMLNDDPDALAAALNDIAPGAAAALPQDIEQPAPAPATKTPIKEAGVDDFLRAQTDSRPLASRIQPDSTLPTALKDVENKAFAGVPEAQHDIAALYTAGQGGVKTDFPRAAQWFEEAALGGVANARYNLGVLYHQGLGVSQDTSKAINWYKAAAAQNHPEAQYNLGIAYIEGVGTEYNPQKAASNFESAARSGILEASYNLGLIYENGLLGSPQVEDAIYWYNRAAEQGSPEGKAALNQLAKNMGYNEERVKDIYNKRKATLEPAAKPATAAPAVITPASAPADVVPKAAAPAPSKQQSGGIPVLPLDEEAAAPAELVVPTNPIKAARSNNPARVDSSTIAQIQEQLMNYGLYPGPADGRASDVMADAIRSYQRTHDLAQDGRASEILLMHMLAQEMGSQE